MTAYSVARARAQHTWTFETSSLSGLNIRRAMYTAGLPFIHPDSYFWRLFGRQGVEIERTDQWADRMRSTHPPMSLSSVKFDEENYVPGDERPIHPQARCL